MSYDLYLNFRDNKQSTDAFINYFSSRPNYKLNNGQAVYSNEDTGVYFSFEWKLPSEQKDDELNYDAAFNLNYVRPHPFALEAEPELSAFIKEFNLSVEDPQIDGIKGDVYSKEGFLSGWNAGNQFAMGAMKSRGAGSPHSLPREEIERCWLWNYHRNKLSLELTEDVFVPKIMFCVQRGPVNTLVCWTDAIPVALPKVDLVLLNRDVIAKAKFFVFKSPGIAVVSFDDLAPQLASYPINGSDPLSYRFLGFKQAPAGLVKYFNDQPSLSEKFKIVDFDQVLTAST